MSKMHVELLNHMGSDLTVVNAARVSFNKESKQLTDADIKRLSYLANHEHWSPFSHCFLQFRIKAPIFVARQLAKHQIGLAWNEVSRRYVDYAPEMFMPEYFRPRSPSAKQGSLDIGKVHIDVSKFFREAWAKYNELLQQNVAPEMARMVLPQSLMTEWWWSGSLMAFARVVRLRLDPHAQKETQFIAERIDEECCKLFPYSWKALFKTGGSYEQQQTAS